MDHEQGRSEAREDVVAVLEGTAEERREQLARIAVWAVSEGKRIARRRDQVSRAERTIRSTDVALNEAELQRSQVLAEALRQTRAAV